MSESKRIRLWRLVKAHRSDSAWDGEGACLFGGRWNSRGRRMVYTSSALSLALLEILVHLDPAAPMPELVAIPIDVPATDIMASPLKTPIDIRIEFCHDLKTTRQTGDRWLDERKGSCLAVPSTIIPIEQNVLLNPAHPAFKNYPVGSPRPFSSVARCHLGTWVGFIR